MRHDYNTLSKCYCIGDLEDLLRFDISDIYVKYLALFSESSDSLLYSSNDNSLITFGQFSGILFYYKNLP